MATKTKDSARDTSNKNGRSIDFGAAELAISKRLHEAPESSPERAALTEASFALHAHARGERVQLVEVENLLRQGGLSDDEIATMDLDGDGAAGAPERVARRKHFGIHFDARRMVEEDLLRSLDELRRLSASPHRDRAHRAAELAIQVMTTDGEPPADELSRLADALKGHEDRHPGGERDLRILLRLVQDVTPDLMNGHPLAPANVGEQLRSALVGTFEAVFETLSNADCARLLASYTDEKPKRRQRSTDGICADLVMLAGAWGYADGTARGRDSLLKELSKARKRGEAAVREEASMAPARKR